MRYLLMIYGVEPTYVSLNEQQRAASHDAWMSYTDDFGKSGKMMSGEALQPSSTATVVRAKAGGIASTDGPFVESKESLGGYYIIDAADLDEAIAWSAKMPVIADGGAVEIRPIVEFD